MSNNTEALKEREQIRLAHAEWSQSTFGDVGPVGPLKHLSKEALEAAAAVDDLSEWADMQFLLWDAQRRAGITDEQITAAMVEKLAVNKQRQWPSPKDGEPRLHIKPEANQAVPEPFGFVTKRCAEHMHDNDHDENHWMWSISAVVIGCDPKLKHEVPVYLHPAPSIKPEASND